MIGSYQLKEVCLMVIKGHPLFVNTGSMAHHTYTASGNFPRQAIKCPYQWQVV